MEQDGAVAILHAELKNLDGEFVHDVLNLGERLINSNGELVYRKSIASMICFGLILRLMNEFRALNNV